jgi:lactoylglutathione lyase
MVAPSFLKIFVADLDRAQAFYGVVFGLQERARFSTPHFDERILISGDGEAGGVALVICQRPGDAAPQLGDAYGPIGFRVKDLEALHGAALAAGGAEMMAPRDVGAARVSLLTDPDGHTLELLSL